MRIGTYNVQAFRGYPAEAARRVLGRGDTAAAAQHFVRVFAVLGCDVLALEEGVSVGQIARVAEALGVAAATFPSPVHWPGHILTRYPILETESYAPAPSRAAELAPFSRMGGAARLGLPDGSELWVAAVHLHPRYDDIRVLEKAIIEAHVWKYLRQTEQVVVLGDFNCPPGTPMHSALEELGFVNAMEAAGGGVQPTHDTTGRLNYPVDHIYVSPALIPALVDAKAVRYPGFYHHGALAPGRWLHSDHIPLVAELRL